MAEKQIKTKDMIIAIICTLLTILAIVFYFLPAFSVEHSASVSFELSEKLNYSAWDMTQAIFINVKDWGSRLLGLICIKDLYSIAIMFSGLLMPISLAFMIATTVFTYLSWLKGEKFKKYCFLFSLCSMILTTISLISTWYLAIQLQNTPAGSLEYFKYNIKGSISYGSFVSLIIAFVIAIVACAYNYFLDNFDEDDDEDEEDEDEVEEPKKTNKVNKEEHLEESSSKQKVTTQRTTTKKPTTPKKTTK